MATPGKATTLYHIPTPEDSPIGGRDAPEVALSGGAMNSVHSGGRSLRIVNRLVMFILPNNPATGANFKEVRCLGVYLTINAAVGLPDYLEVDPENGTAG